MSQQLCVFLRIKALRGLQEGRWCIVDIVSVFVYGQHEHLNQDYLHFYSEVVLTLIFFIYEFPREAKKNKTGKGEEKPLH